MKADRARPPGMCSVRSFAAWWLRCKEFKVPAEGAIRQAGATLGVTLYRDGPFQVQLFIGAPGASAPRHAHPNVDSLEYHVAGHNNFHADRGATLFGMFHILEGEFHDFQSGPEGGCLISIQKWLNGVQPTSVEDDWFGEPIDENHMQKLNAKTYHVQLAPGVYDPDAPMRIIKTYLNEEDPPGIVELKVSVQDFMHLNIPIAHEPGKIFSKGWQRPDDLPAGAVYCVRCVGFYMTGGEHICEVSVMNTRERLARAMFNCQFTKISPRPDARLEAWEEAPERTREIYIAHVDAMLDELMKPSEEVIEPVRHWDGRDTALLVWEGMIDAIKEGK